MAPLCLTFWGTARLFSKAGAPLHNPTSNVWGFQVLQIFTNIYCLFDSSHPSACKFLISLKTNDIKHLFHMLFDYLYIFFGEMFMQILCRGLVAQSCPTLWDPMDCVAHRTPLSMEFSMQEYWSRLLFPSPMLIPCSFLNGVKYLLIGEFKSFFYISETNLLSDICFANIFPCGLSSSSFKNIYFFRLHQVLVVAHRIRWDLPSL